MPLSYPEGKKQNIDEWKVKMISLYKKILSEAEDKGVSILAVPLIGSGKGNVDPADAVEVAVQAMFSYKKKSLVKVLLVSHRADIVDMLTAQCAYFRCTKGGKALEPPQSHTNTGRKDGSSYPRSLPKPKLHADTDSNNSCWAKQVVGRSDHSKGSIDYGVHQRGMVLRSGRELPPGPQTDQLSRSNTDMNGTGKTCKKARDNELKRVNGKVGEEYYKDEVSDHGEPTSLQHTHDFSGGAKRKVSNKAKHNGQNDDVDDDDDGDAKGNESRSGKYTNTDHGDLTLSMAKLSISHTNRKVTKNKPTAQCCIICLEEISNPKTLQRCGHVFCTDCIDRFFARYKPVCPSCNMYSG